VIHTLFQNLSSADPILDRHRRDDQGSVSCLEARSREIAGPKPQRLRGSNLVPIHVDHLNRLRKRLHAAARSGSSGPGRLPQTGDRIAAVHGGILGTQLSERSRERYARQDGRNEEVVRAQSAAETAAQQAVAAFREAVAIDPEDADAQAALARLGR
jgi:hypothetical protein